LRNGWPKEHKTSREEIADLLAVAARDLEASATNGLHNDWKFNIAYNSALQLATAALAATGYQAERNAHHYRVIQTLQFTLGMDAKSILKFDTFRKKRNISDYERSGTVSELEVDEVRKLAARLRFEVEDWLARKHPTLKP
jgi:hypothetical protein